ncbi:MAG: class I SAM-dependent methyltransferase [Bradymonadia bacterium]
MSVDLPTSETVTEAVSRAAARRLEDDTLGALEHVRLFDGGTDGVRGLFIEAFGPAHARRLRVTGPPDLAPLQQAILKGLPEAHGVYWRFGHAHQQGPDDGEMQVAEYGLKYHVQLLGQRNAGLFPQVRIARRWLREHVEGRRILNLFSYTCAFGVVAAAHGARSTINVDTAKGVLAKGQANYALNSLSIDPRAFWRESAKEALKQLKKRGTRLDGVIIDPPPRAVFDKSKRWRFDPLKDLCPTVSASAALLDEGGWLMVVNAGARVTDEALIEAAGLGAPIWTATPDADCPTPEGRPPVRMMVMSR